MPEAASQIGVVSIAHGTAMAEGADGVRTLAPDSPVYADDVIKTSGAGSAVEIHLNDGAVLSQGPDSSIVLDSYVFNPDQSVGEMTIKLIEGSLRSVTGEIVDVNPEGFKIETPLATIGIRGTTTGHIVGGDGQEQHAVVDFVDKPVVITPNGGGTPRVITQDGMGVAAAPGAFGDVRPAPPSVLSKLDQLSSSSLQQSAPNFTDAPTDDESSGGDEGDLQAQAAAEPGGGQGTEVAPEAAPEPILLYPPTGLIPPQPEEPGGTSVIETGSGGSAFSSTTQTTITSGGALGQNDTEVIDTPTEVPEVPTTLDLSAKTDPMTVDLSASPAFYSVTESPDTTTVAGTIVNVIGSSTQSNTITGDTRDNVLTGGAGSDDIFGGNGNDVIFGNGGSDNLNGGAGTDMLSYAGFGSAVNIDFSGTVTYPNPTPTNTDTISNFENATGTDYADTLYGSNGNNVLYGGDGNDLLWGNGGTDSLFGGAGNDNIKFHENLFGSIDGGTGTDTFLVWSGGSYDITGLTSVTSMEALTFNANGGSVTAEAADFGIFDGSSTFTVDSASTGAIETLEIKALDTSGETIDLSNLNFGANWESTDKLLLTGNTGDDELTGSNARDSISGNAGLDLIYGGADNDTVSGGAGKDTIYGGTGNDSLSGDAQDDSLYGDGGNDTLYGGVNNDTLDGGDGSDALYGESGNDKLLGSAGVDTLDGGTGTDTISYLHLSGGSGITADLDGVVSNDGQGASDTITNFDVFEASNYGDVITTSDTATSTQTLYAKDGNDWIKYVGNANSMSTTIDAGYGDDKISIEATVIAGTSIAGCAGTDTLEANSNTIIDARNLTVTDVEKLWVTGTTTTLQMGMDNVSGNTWDAIISSGCKWALSAGVGGETSDLSGMTFSTLDGTVQVTGGTGGDTLIMGTNMSSSITFDGGSIGLDTLEYTSNGATDELNNVSNVETITLGDATTNITTVDSLVANGAGLTVDGSALSSSHTLTWNGAAETDGSFYITGGAGADQITGAGNSDSLSGGDGDDQLFGGGGDDTLYGGIGNDQIYGGDGIDTIYGEAGSDKITGGNGADQIIGGTGNDTFNYDSFSEGGDTISDFATGVDKFNFLTADVNSGLLGTGLLNAANFKEVNDATYTSDGLTGVDGDDYFVYVNDGGTHALYFDSNGSGAGGQTLIADFTSDVSLIESDIELV